MKYILYYLLFFFSLNVSAFQVEPFVQVMEPIGQKSNAVFKITNTSEESLPIETELLKSMLNDNDVEQTTVSDDFFIMPPQALIKPNSSQIFRVRYLGDPSITYTYPYRVIFKQLSLDKDAITGSHIKVLFNFSALILISPKDAKEELKVNITPSDKSYKITIENQGNKFIDLSQKKLKIIGEKKTLMLNWQEFSGLTQFQFILPNRNKFFLLTPSTISSIGNFQNIEFTSI